MATKNKTNITEVITTVRTLRLSAEQIERACLAYVALNHPEFTQRELTAKSTREIHEVELLWEDEYAQVTYTFIEETTR